MKNGRMGNLIIWIHKNFKFLQKELKTNIEKDQVRFRCGCNNVVSSSLNLHQLEKFFCYYWPNSCQNYFSDGELALDHVGDTPENVINGEYESFDSITEDCEVNTSSLVLIVPVKQEQTARKDRVPNKHKTKVYSVASLRSPQLVLTLLRGKTSVTKKEKCLTKKESCIEVHDSNMNLNHVQSIKVKYEGIKPSAKLMRKISNYNQRLYKEEPLLFCRRRHCLHSEVTVNGHHVCGDYILKNN